MFLVPFSLAPSMAVSFVNISSATTGPDKSVSICSLGICSRNFSYHSVTVGYDTPTTSMVCCLLNFFCQHHNNIQIVSSGSLLPLNQQLLLILNGRWHVLHRHRSSCCMLRTYRLWQCGQWILCPKMACFNILRKVPLVGTWCSIFIQMDLVNCLVMLTDSICQVHLLYITLTLTLLGLLVKNMT